MPSGAVLVLLNLLIVTPQVLAEVSQLLDDLAGRLSERAWSHGPWEHCRRSLENATLSKGLGHLSRAPPTAAELRPWTASLPQTRLSSSLSTGSRNRSISFARKPSPEEAQSRRKPSRDQKYISTTTAYWDFADPRHYYAENLENKAAAARLRYWAPLPAEDEEEEPEEEDPEDAMGVLYRLPQVEPAEDIVISAFKRASRLQPDKGLKGERSKEISRTTKQLNYVMEVIGTKLTTYIDGFPLVDFLHPFEKALLELTLSRSKYERTIERVDKVKKGWNQMGKGMVAQVKKADSANHCVAMREQNMRELENYFRKNARYIEDMKQTAQLLRRLPIAELQTPTVALVGAPNVGKSRLVRALSSGMPEVNNYPFTTRGIKMGHFFIDYQRFVVTDTPGILWRPDEERNNIEQLAIATLEYLPTCIIFVLDLSGSSGSTVEDQLNIRKELRERFADRRPWLDVLSKAMLVPALGGTAPSDHEATWVTVNDEDAERAIKAVQGALVVSAEEDYGIVELKDRLTRTLKEHRMVLENPEEEGDKAAEEVAPSLSKKERQQQEELAQKREEAKKKPVTIDSGFADALLGDDNW